MSKAKIEVLPENVKFLREEILAPLTAREIADLMHVSRITLYNWMKDGIASDAPGLQRYYLLEKYIEKHVSRSVMEGKIVPLTDMPPKIDRRCTILEPRKEKFSRCRYSRVIGSKFCKMHSDKIRILGAVFLTLDGDIVGMRKNQHMHGKLPKRCKAYTYGGYRCVYAGKLRDGLCPNHFRELESRGKVTVMENGLAVKRYAEEG